MSVYKPKKGRFWHYDFWLGGERYTGSTGAETRKGALKVEIKKREAAGRGELNKRVKAIPTLNDAAITWWSTKSDKRSATQMLARVTVAVELVGKNLPVNEVGFADIQRAIQKRRGMLTPKKQPPANATVNRDIIATLRPTIELAQEMLNDGVGDPVTFPVIKWGKLTLDEPAPKPKGLTAAEVQRVVDAVPEYLRDFVRFQARYGCRISEMFFTPDDVEIEERRVLIRGKGDQRKAGGVLVIPLLPEDAAMLATRVGRARAARLKTVWFREVVGRNRKARLVARTPIQVGRQISEAMTVAGVRESKGARGSHSLRHTAGTNILRATGNVRLAQKLLGHTNLKSTLVYAHAMEDDVRAGLEQLSRPSPEPSKNDDEKDHDKQSKA